MAKTTNTEPQVMKDGEFEQLLQQQKTLQKELEQLEKDRPDTEMVEPKNAKELQARLDALRKEDELKELIVALGRERDLESVLTRENDLMEDLAALKAQKHIAVSVKNALEEVQLQDQRAQEEDLRKLFLEKDKKEELKAKEQESLLQLADYEDGIRFEKKWLQNDEDLKIRKATMESAAKKSAESKKELGDVIERIRENRREQEDHKAIMDASRRMLQDYLESCEKNYRVGVSEESLEQLNRERNLLLESNREITIHDENELRAAVTGSDEEAVKLCQELEVLIRRRRKAEKENVFFGEEKTEFLGIDNLKEYADIVKMIHYQGLPDNEKKLFQKQMELTEEEKRKFRHDIEAVVSRRLEKESKILFLEDRLGISSFAGYEEKMLQILALAGRYNNIFDYKEKTEPLGPEDLQLMQELQKKCYTARNDLEREELERLSDKAVRRQLTPEETQRFDVMKETLRQKRTQKVLTTKKTENDFTRLKQLEERYAARLYQDILRMDKILLQEVREMNEQYRAEAESRKKELRHTEKLLLRDIREENKKREKERKSAQKEITMQDLRTLRRKKEELFREDLAKELKVAENAKDVLQQQYRMLEAADRATDFLANRFPVYMNAFVSSLFHSRIRRLEKELEVLKKQESTARKTRDRLGKDSRTQGKEVKRLFKAAEQYAQELEELTEIAERSKEEERKRKNTEKKLENAKTAGAEKSAEYQKISAELDTLDQKLEEIARKVHEKQEELKAEKDTTQKLSKEIRQKLAGEEEERRLFLESDAGKIQREANLRMVQLAKALAAAGPEGKAAEDAAQMQEAVKDLYATGDIRMDEKMIDSLKACYRMVCELSGSEEDPLEAMEKLDVFADQLSSLRETIHDAVSPEEKAVEEIRKAAQTGQGFWDTLSAKTAQFASEKKQMLKLLGRVPEMLQEIYSEWETSGTGEENSLLDAVTTQLQERYAKIEEEDRKEEQKTGAEEKLLFARKLKLAQQSGKDATASIKSVTAYQTERKKKIRKVNEEAVSIRKELKETQKQIADVRKAIEELQKKWDARREDILQRGRQIEEKNRQIFGVDQQLDEKNLSMSIVQKAKRDLEQLRKAKEERKQLEFLRWVDLREHKKEELAELEERIKKAEAAREATQELEENKQRDIEFLAKLCGRKGRILRSDPEALYDALDRIYVNGLSATEYFRVMAPELNINKSGVSMKEDAAVEISRMLKSYLEEPVRKGVASTFLATEDDKGMLHAIKARAAAGDTAAKVNVDKYNRIAEQMYADMNRVRKEVLNGSKKKNLSAEENMRQAAMQTAVRISEGSHRKQSVLKTEKKGKK